MFTFQTKRIYRFTLDDMNDFINNPQLWHVFAPACPPQMKKNVHVNAPSLNNKSTSEWIKHTIHFKQTHSGFLFGCVPQRKHDGNETGPISRDKGVTQERLEMRLICRGRGIEYRCKYMIFAPFLGLVFKLRSKTSIMLFPHWRTCEIMGAFVQLLWVCPAVLTRVSH